MVILRKLKLKYIFENIVTMSNADYEYKKVDLKKICAERITKSEHFRKR